jgi:uncharacterized protein YegL/uncharacterized GH25 family protein
MVTLALLLLFAFLQHPSLPNQAIVLAAPHAQTLGDTRLNGTSTMEQSVPFKQVQQDAENVLHGRLVDAVHGNPIANTAGEIDFVADAPENSRMDVAITTDANGFYTETLEPGNYRLHFSGFGVYPDQWHDNGGRWEGDSQVVRLGQEDQPAHQVEVTTNLAPGSRLKGTITDVARQSRIKDSLPFAIEYSYAEDSSIKGSISGVQLDAQGNFVTPERLLPGAYRLEFQGVAGYVAGMPDREQYPDTFYPNADLFHATVVNVPADGQDVLVDTSVTPYITLIGTLADQETNKPFAHTNDGSPYYTAHIQLYDEKSVKEVSPIALDTDATGNYTATFKYIVPGKYAVKFDLVRTDEGLPAYPAQFHGASGSGNVADARLIDLNSGNNYLDARLVASDASTDDVRIVVDSNTPVDATQENPEQDSAQDAQTDNRIAQTPATFVGRVIDDSTSRRLTEKEIGLQFYPLDETASPFAFAGRTDSTGVFTVTNLLPGSGDYLIEFSAIEGNYPPQYYNRGAIKADADVVTIDDGVPDSPLEMRVVPGETFIGKLLDEATGRPVGGAEVNLRFHAADGSFSIPPFTEPAFNVTTESNGIYTVTGLLEGSYFVEYIRVSTDSDYASEYPQQYHEYGAENTDEADALTVSGEDNPAVVVSHIRPYATWQGVLNDSVTGEPITYANGELLFYAIHPITEQPAYYESVAVITDGDGRYRIETADQIETGRYLLQFTHFDNEGYREQYHNDQRDASWREKFRQEYAQDIQLQPGERTGMLTSWLEPLAELNGTLMDAVSGDPLAHTRAEVRFDGYCGEVSDSITTDKDGKFTIGRDLGLCGNDNYVVYFWDIAEPSHPDKYPPQYYNEGKRDKNDADVLRLQPGSNEVTFKLATGSLVIGTVTDANTGLPLANTTIEVTFMDVDGDEVDYLPDSLSLTTDANGVYTTQGGISSDKVQLLPGIYKAHFFGVPGYQDRYYGGDDTFWSAGAFIVPTDGSPVTLNIALNPLTGDTPATLNGTLLNTLDGSPIANVNAMVRFEGQETGFVKNVRIVTDQNGNYVASGLKIDSYTIFFYDIYDEEKRNAVADQYHNDTPGSFDTEGNLLVPLVAGSQLTSYLMPGSFLSGTITDADTGVVVTDTAKLEKTMVCTDVVDIIFVLDGSGSVSGADFTKMGNFVQAFVNSYAIGPEAARVGIVQFSSSSQVESALSDDVQQINDTVSRMSQLNGGTNIGAGLQSAYSELSWNGRDNVKPFVVLLTDGYGSGDPISVAYDLKTEKNATVLGIAVGSGPNMQEITAIASEPDSEHVFALDTFDDLNVFLNSIVNATCSIRLPEPFKVFIYKTESNELADSAAYWGLINTEGQYTTSRRILPGDYAVRFVDVDGYMNGTLTYYTDRYHNNQPVQETDETQEPNAMLVTIPNDGSDVTVDTTLDPYISLVGTLLDGNGTPIKTSVDIALQSSDDESIIKLGNFDLDRNGTYVIPNDMKIEPGSYALRFDVQPQGSTYDLPMQWHDNGASRENATSVELWGANTLTTRMVSGVQITGQLTDAKHNTPIANSDPFTIYVYEPGAHPYDWMMEMHASTDANGMYTTLEQLMPGEYVLRFADVSAPVAGEEEVREYVNSFVASNGMGVKSVEDAGIVSVRMEEDQTFTVDVSLSSYLTYKIWYIWIGVVKM